MMTTTGNTRWVRLSDDKVLAGVSSGLARQLGIDPWVLRLIWVLASFATFGGAALLYIVCVICFPLDSRIDEARQKMILGVCSRVEQRGDMEVGLARFLACMLLLATGGAALIGYIVLHFVLSQQTKTTNSQ